MNIIGRLSKYIYAVTVVFIFWYLLYLALDSFVIPNPIDVIVVFSETAITIFKKHILASLFRLVIAIFITTLIGYSIGLLIGISKRLDRMITPIIYLFFPVPRIAFLPVFMILFGLGDLSKIILIIAIAVFQIIVSIRDGVKEISKDILISANSLNLTFKQMIKHIYIPATLPKLFTALRIALGSSIAALFFAENYATKAGIGYYIMNSWLKVDYEGMYAGIISISLMGILLFKFVDVIEGRVCKWNSL